MEYYKLQQITQKTNHIHEYIKKNTSLRNRYNLSFSSRSRKSKDRNFKPTNHFCVYVPTGYFKPETRGKIQNYYTYKRCPGRKSRGVNFRVGRPVLPRSARRPANWFGFIKTVLKTFLEIPLYGHGVTVQHLVVRTINVDGVLPNESRARVGFRRDIHR